MFKKLAINFASKKNKLFNNLLGDSTDKIDISEKYRL